MPEPKPSLHAIARLRILATSDVHSYLTGWDQRFEVHYPNRGLARLASAIAEARKTAGTETLLFDNGDFLQGTPVADWMARCATPDAPALAAAMNALDYDAVGLGNHDFDYGLEYLRDTLTALNCPALASNCTFRALFPTQPNTVLERSVIDEAGQSHKLRIGLCSVLPQQTAMWNARHLSGHVDISDPVQVAKDNVALLRTQLKCDLVIVLCHSGIADAASDGAAEHFAALIARIPGITALITGHSHKLFPHRHHDGIPGVDVAKGTLFDVPTVMPGYAGQVAGCIDLVLQKSDAGWVVTGSSSRLLPSKGSPEAASVVAAATPALESCASELNACVGETKAHVHSYFSLLRANAGQHALASAMITEGERMIAQGALAPLPVLAAVAPNIAGGRAGPMQYVDIPIGPVTARHLGTLNPFFNSVVLWRMRLPELRLWLERSVAVFGPTSVSPHTPLHCEEAPIFTFDAIFGLEVDIDPTRPAAFDALGGALANPGRITSIRHNGAPVSAAAEFWLAMTSYRAAGGGTFPLPLDRSARIDTGQSLTDLLRNRLADHTLEASALPNPWRLCPPTPLPVILETSPKARYCLEDISEFAPQTIGETSDGFLMLQATIPAGLAKDPQTH